MQARSQNQSQQAMVGRTGLFFRSDTRPPEKIFGHQTGGFEPKDHNPEKEWWKGAIEKRKISFDANGYCVSLSTHLNSAALFPMSNKEYGCKSYIYFMALPAITQIDVHQDLTCKHAVPFNKNNCIIDLHSFQAAWASIRLTCMPDYSHSINADQRKLNDLTKILASFMYAQEVIAKSIKQSSIICAAEIIQSEKTKERLAIDKTNHFCNFLQRSFRFTGKVFMNPHFVNNKMMLFKPINSTDPIMTYHLDFTNDVQHAISLLNQHALVDVPRVLKTPSIEFGMGGKIQAYPYESEDEKNKYEMLMKKF